LGASGTYRHHNNYRSGGGQIISFSQYEKINYLLTVKYQQNKYTYFKADILADDGWNIGYAALPIDVGYAAAKIGSLSVHWENSTKRFYKWQTKIYANSIRHFMDDTKRPNVPMHMDMPGKSKTIGIYSEGELLLKHQQKLLLRADGSSAFLKASMTMYQAGQSPMYMLTWPDNRKNYFFKPLATVNIVSAIRYTLAKDNNNEPLPFVAPLKNINSVSYQPGHFSVQLETETALSQNKVSGHYGEDVTPGYFLLNSRFGYNSSILKKNAEIQAGVENIFDKKYHEHLDWGNIPRPGRNIYLQIKIAF